MSASLRHSKLLLRRAAVAALAAAGVAAPAAQAAVPPANVTPPSVTGTPEVGQALTGNRGTWTDDASNDYAYDWLVCRDATQCRVADHREGPTPGAYTPEPADAGKFVRLRVYATSPGGTTIATSDATLPVERPEPSAPPVVQVLPSVEVAQPGQPWPPVSGQTLRGRVGEWDDHYKDYNYVASWLRCDAGGGNCENIASRVLNGPAEEFPRTLTTADVGKTLRYEVTAFTSRFYADVFYKTEVSPPTPVVGSGGPPVSLAPPQLMAGTSTAALAPITGPVAVGDTLTATQGAWSVADGFVVTWLRCDRLGVVCSPIPGASSPPGTTPRWSYAVQNADLGSSIRVDVTATSFLGSATQRTGPVKVGPDPPPANPDDPGGGDTPAGQERATVRIRSARVTGSGRTLAVYVSLGAPGTVAVVADAAGRRLGKATREIGRGRVAIAVRLSKAATRLLARGRAVRTKVSVSLVTPRGNRGAQSATITIRPAR